MHLVPIARCIRREEARRAFALRGRGDNRALLDKFFLHFHANVEKIISSANFRTTRDRC